MVLCFCSGESIDNFSMQKLVCLCHWLSLFYMLFLVSWSCTWMSILIWKSSLRPYFCAWSISYALYSLCRWTWMHLQCYIWIYLQVFIQNSNHYALFVIFFTKSSKAFITTTVFFFKIFPSFCRCIIYPCTFRSIVLNFSDYVAGLYFWSRVLIDLALPCMKPGLRVFEGFTVGFHPRSWEVVRRSIIM